MWKKLFFVAFMFFTVACNDDHREQQDRSNDTPLMSYESNQDQAEKIETKSIGDVGGYHQSEQRGVNALDSERGYTDPYTNEETIYIANELRKQKQIVQAQVASTEDEIIIGVMLTDDGEKTITNDMVEDYVRKLIPDSDKQIIIFTDDVEWHHLKDIDSRFEGDLEEEFEFFYKERNGLR